MNRGYLQTAARAGHQLHIWFCGLDSPELHLRVYGNSTAADPATGQPLCPRLLLEMKACKITAPADLSNAPEWAQPIIVAAIHLHNSKP